jgi:hypothetical protein
LKKKKEKRKKKKEKKGKEEDNLLFVIIILNYLLDLLNLNLILFWNLKYFYYIKYDIIL